MNHIFTPHRNAKSPQILEIYRTLVCCVETSSFSAVATELNTFQLTIPRRAAFMARHPEIQFDLVVQNRTTDLVEEGVDLALPALDTTQD